VISTSCALVKRISVETADFALRFAFVFHVKLQELVVEVAGKYTRFPVRALFGAVGFIKLRDNIFR